MDQTIVAPRMLQRHCEKAKRKGLKRRKVAPAAQLGYDTEMTDLADTHAGGGMSRANEHGGESAVAAALALCRASHISLTPGRRRILELLAREGRPLGAYEMIDRVAEATGKRPAPISVYRALDFLLEKSLIHRLASRNAYLACGHGHAVEEPIVFLICEVCGDVVEARSPKICGALGDLAAEAEFSPRAQVMEVAGRCRECAAA
jgi:Fur family transcriptional regulator, zinc uptake regulator